MTTMQLCENKGWRFCSESELKLLDPRVCLAEKMLTARTRMQKIKHMKDNNYGQYTEITDEKEVVRITA